MADYKKIAELLLRGVSRRNIADAFNTSSKTITKINKYISENNITLKELSVLTEDELRDSISPKKEYLKKKARPELADVHKKLAAGAAIKETWIHYIEQYQALNIETLSYTRYFELVNDNERDLRATEDRDLRPGDMVIAKWLNRSVEMVTEEGDAWKAYVFMVYFPVSRHFFLFGAKAKDAVSTERIIADSFKTLRAVPRCLVLDNCRCFWANNGRSRQELDHLLIHYGFTVMHLEQISSKAADEFCDTAKHVEKLVRTQIYPSLPQLEGFLSDIQEESAESNVNKRFSRQKLFEDEISFMTPAPNRYEPYTEENVSIQPNLHVYFAGTYYSVPYSAYREGKTVAVHAYADRIEIWDRGAMIAVHGRTSDRYRTEVTHMPPPDKLGSMPWNSVRLKRWASGIGPETYRVICGIIKRQAIEQQGYMKCIAIMNMVDRYGARKLEEACAGVSDAAVPQAYKIIRELLQKQ